MNEEEKNIQALQDRFEKLSERVLVKQGEATEAEKSLSALTSSLVEAASKDRKQLIEQRAQQAALKDALLAEYHELVSRRDAAELAIYETKFAFAQKVARALHEKSRQNVLALDEAVTNQRIFNNGGRSKLSIAEADKMAVQLDVNIARIKAEGIIAGREEGKAAHALEMAKQELKEKTATI
jgi:hypothetical protein